MTATERAKRSDALYYETVSVTRRVLCDMIANREADLEDAQAENAKLRELSGFMLRCMKRNHDCDCCLVNGEHCEISYIESDARELGIEVDE